MVVAPSVSRSRFRVKLAAFLRELTALFFHPLFQRFFFSDALLCCIFPHVFRYLHAAKMWPAHGAEMSRLRSLLRQCLIMEFSGRHRVKGQVKLVFPSELESGFRERVVAVLSARMSFRQVRRVRGDFVGNHAILNVLFVGQSQMFFRGHITQHRAAIPADHRRADAAGDVVVAGRDVGSERSERVERRFAAPLELLGHVFLDHVHGHVTRPFIHHLHAFGPRALREFALHFEFAELRLIVRIGN